MLSSELEVSQIVSDVEQSCLSSGSLHGTIEVLVQWFTYCRLMYTDVNYLQGQLQFFDGSH